MTTLLAAAARKLSDALYGAFSEQAGEIGERARLAAAMFDTAHEHHRAMALLVEAQLYGSAFVLLRPAFESCVNGLWLLSLAQEGELLAFSEGIVPPPKPDRILRRLKLSQSEHHAGLQGFYDRGHKSLDEYVHSGHLQAASRLGEGYIGSNYSPEFVANLLAHANWFALLAAFALRLSRRTSLS